MPKSISRNYRKVHYRKPLHPNETRIPLFSNNTERLRLVINRENCVETSLDQDLFTGRSSIRICDDREHVVRRGVVVVVDRELITFRAKDIS